MLSGRLMVVWSLWHAWYDRWMAGELAVSIRYASTQYGVKGGVGPSEV
jgi:hypothetical protein